MTPAEYKQAVADGRQITRVELPYKVKVYSPGAGITRYRNGHEARVAWRHFATKAEAIAFCGDAKKVKYAPGEAFRPVAL